MTRETANPEFYDRDSRKYDEQRWQSAGGAYTNQAQQAIVRELTADWTGHRVVEVGPGTARFTIPLCERGAKMTVVDISAGMLEVARQNVTDAGCADCVEAFRQGSIYELPFEDGAFDHAISLNVFNHLERAGDALRELARVTRPGSTLLFNYANLHSWYWPAARRIRRRGTAVGQDVFSIWERPRDVRRMIADAGLALVRRVGHVHMPRAMERYHLTGAVRLLDRLSRRGPLEPLAATHYCFCRRLE